MCNRVYVPAGESQGLEALVRYMMRSPVSLSRLRFTPGSPEVVYLHKGGHDEIEPTEGERVDAMEFVARVLVQIPDGDDPPAVRSRPPRVSSLRRRDARGGIHHPTRRDQAHPGSSPKAREGRSPASARP